MRGTLFLVIILLSCSTNVRNAKIEKTDIVLGPTVSDSVRWFFYAYTYKSKILFKREAQTLFYDPIECEVISKRSSSDSNLYFLSYEKDSLEYMSIYDGIMVFSIKYDNGVFIPQTGMIKIDGFEQWGFIKKDNAKTENEFKNFLRSNKYYSARMSKWLSIDAKDLGFY